RPHRGRRGGHARVGAALLGAVRVQAPQEGRRGEVLHGLERVLAGEDVVDLAAGRAVAVLVIHPVVAARGGTAGVLVAEAARAAAVGGEAARARGALDGAVAVVHAGLELPAAATGRVHEAVRAGPRLGPGAEGVAVVVVESVAVPLGGAVSDGGA